MLHICELSTFFPLTLFHRSLLPNHPFFAFFNNKLSQPLWQQLHSMSTHKKITKLKNTLLLHHSSLYPSTFNSQLNSLQYQRFIRLYTHIHAKLTLNWYFTPQKRFSFIIYFLIIFEKKPHILLCNRYPDLNLPIPDQ